MIIIFIVTPCIVLSIAIVNRVINMNAGRTWGKYTHDDSTTIWYVHGYPRTRERAIRGDVTKRIKEEEPKEFSNLYM